jgi:twitching motility protein PilT
MECVRTMNDDSRILIDLALRAGAISPRQAALLREEMDMFPGQKVGSIMLKRQYITAEELMNLQAQAAQLAALGTAPPVGHNPAPGGIRLPGAAGVASGGGHSRISLGGGRDGGAGISRITMARQLPEERKLFDYVRFAAERNCTDLHLVIGRPPFVRQGGEIHYLKDEPLTPEAAEELNMSVLDDAQRDRLIGERQVDFALEIPNAGRVRGNICKQRLGWEGAYRIFPPKLRTFEDLGLPPVLKTLASYSEGLVLVTGCVNSGKNTTVAAMLDHINRTRDEHIVTVEEPVEYLHEPRRCTVTQREIGVHSRSFAMALRAALRQDPDVIFVGEMRDLETISIAITASETGHLVFGTLHTSSAMRSVARMVNAYPVSQRAQVCMMVAESLRGVVAQYLVPRLDHKSVALAQEIMIVTTGIAQAIRDAKYHQLLSLIEAGGKHGMCTMDDSLMALVERGDIAPEEACIRAENRALFAPLLARQGPRTQPHEEAQQWQQSTGI